MPNMIEKIIAGPNGLAILGKPFECPACRRMVCFISCATGRSLCIECSEAARRALGLEED